MTSSPPTAPAVVNEHALFACALQRSGHHPVIQWILINSGVSPCFLNDCRPRENPFASANLTCSFVPGVDVAAEQAGILSRKALLICSYEDQELAAIYGVDFDTDMERWTGRSARTTHLLVLRDPFNLIASKFRWAVHGTK